MLGRGDSDRKRGARDRQTCFFWLIFLLGHFLVLGIGLIIKNESASPGPGGRRGHLSCCHLKAMEKQKLHQEVSGRPRSHRKVDKWSGPSWIFCCRPLPALQLWGERLKARCQSGVSHCFGQHRQPYFRTKKLRTLVKSGAELELPRRNCNATCSISVNWNLKNSHLQVCSISILHTNSYYRCLQNCFVFSF